MKKGKVLGKGHIAVVLMVLALGAAVWLNMRFSSQKYFGEAKYVDNSSGDAVETSASAKENAEDYFTTAFSNPLAFSRVSILLSCSIRWAKSFAEVSAS